MRVQLGVDIDGLDLLASLPLARQRRQPQVLRDRVDLGLFAQERQRGLIVCLNKILNLDLVYKTFDTRN